MTSTLIAFPPILGPRAHTLILGSMPGGKSLERGQYYAHPQNQFWRFMGDLYGAGLSLPYEARLDILYQAGIAVWDVLYACEREGSLDADIKKAQANDFERFFRENPTIRRVVFDSLTAEAFYRRLVLPTLTSTAIEYGRVPSPSPAHARLPYADKLAVWKQVLLRG